MTVEQQVELLLQSARSHDAQIGQIIEAQAKISESQAKNERILADVLESINALARIAHSHDQRIDNLEKS